MREEESASWFQDGRDDDQAKYNALAEDKWLDDEQEAGDAAFEAALIAEMEVQGIANQGAEDDDDDEGLLILEGEDHPPTASELRRRHPILGLKGRPISLHRYAMLNATAVAAQAQQEARAQARAQAQAETQAQAEAEAEAADHDIPMSDAPPPPYHHLPPPTRKAVSHRAKPTDKAQKEEEDNRPLRKKGNGAINKMLPVRGLNSNWKHVKSGAVFNHGKALPKVRRENLPSSSRPMHLWHLTDEEYLEYLKEEKRGRRG